MAAQHYDAVVIGAGQAGVPLSQALAGSGRSTALIEREHVGGPTRSWAARCSVSKGARSWR
jgi:pyruvate/2-oxoglutarate dehydrogenase complex dihydrolipoamide dehydrogenase (E3) component